MLTKLPPGFAKAAIVRALLLILLAAFVSVLAVLFLGAPHAVVALAVGVTALYCMASTQARLRFRLANPPAEVARPTGDRVALK